MTPQWVLILVLSLSGSEGTLYNRATGMCETVQSVEEVQEIIGVKEEYEFIVIRSTSQLYCS